MKEKMMIFLKKKKVSEPSNPPDELVQNVSKKSFSDELFLHFFAKVHNLTVFSIFYMIRIRFFGPGALIQNGFRRAQYKDREPNENFACEIMQLFVFWFDHNESRRQPSAGQWTNRSNVQFEGHHDLFLSVYWFEGSPFPWKCGEGEPGKHDRSDGHLAHVA